MPSTNPPLRERWLTPRNVTILTAIAVALPAAYLFHTSVRAEQADFLLLLALGVGVPTALEGFVGSLREAVRLSLGACAVIAALFTGVYFATRSVAGEFPAAVVAFVVSYLGPALVAGYLRSRPG